ncbi:MAG: hypothetical protein BGO41_14705 [Clostridiales bacterium 38-18]|nr:MAG: hypothetical protein BGO41_14705 [Clostridiales bacterium 38-18]
MKMKWLNHQKVNNKVKALGDEKALDMTAIAEVDQDSASFYADLRVKVLSWLKDKKIPKGLGEVIFFAPDLFYLMWQLTFDPKLDGIHKKKAAYALLYFMLPIDFIPDILGPTGYADDLFVVATTLNSYFNDVPPSVLTRYWKGNTQLMSVIQKILGEVEKGKNFFNYYVKKPYRLLQLGRKNKK